MKHIRAIFAFLLFSSSLLATGWNDYSLDIGDGYMVFRANSMDVSIGKVAGEGLILYPDDYEE